MANVKLITFEKILFLSVLALSILGFWYFEESILLKVLIIMLALGGLFVALKNKKDKISHASNFEFLSLLILYLGIYVIYNILYSINLPLYAAMVVVLILVTALFFSMLSLDQVDTILPKEVFRGLILLLGLVVLELFLGLYFWPIEPEAKSLILVVVFYLITSIIYLYIHSMLRLNKIRGYLIVSILILAIILLVIWLRLPK